MMPPADFLRCKAQVALCFPSLSLKSILGITPQVRFLPPLCKYHPPRGIFKHTLSLKSSSTGPKSRIQTIQTWDLLVVNLGLIVFVRMKLGGDIVINTGVVRHGSTSLCLLPLGEHLSRQSAKRGFEFQGFLTSLYRLIFAEGRIRLKCHSAAGTCFRFGTSFGKPAALPLDVVT